MHELAVLSATMFAGALVCGLTGFAFSAIPGAILLHLIPPQEAVPLLMACSIAVQSASLLWLRQIVPWQQSLRLILGGALGLAPSLYLLVHANAAAFRIGFGCFLAAYSIYMLLKPRQDVARDSVAKADLGGVGLAGGLIGGLTAMPGAAPILWSDLAGVPKEKRRGLVQPYIAAMQVASLALLFGSGQLTEKIAWEFTLSVPALAAGSLLGIYLFGRVNDRTFRIAVLAALLLSGVLFLVHV
jgi:uncharacterized membrane protein YfcA